MSAGVVYALIDPRPERLGQIRYIGKSSNLRKRKVNYRSMIRNGDGHSPALRRWFKKLNTLGLTPTFKVLQECLFAIDEAEQAWIDKGRRKKWPLLNCREGGIGGSLSEEAKARISGISRARWADPAYVERWEKAHAAKLGHPSIEAWKVAKAERDTKHQANMLVHQQNMLKAAERRREREAVQVPLTHQGVAFVPLTRGKRATIDVEDWGRVSKHAWHAQRKGGYWRAKRSMGDGACELLNRFIMRAMAGQSVRHGDGDQLNCCKTNLIVRSTTMVRGTALEEWGQRMRSYYASGTACQSS